MNPSSKERRYLFSGHRGFNDGEIENTKKAFQRAIDAGVDFVEFDVKRTLDRVPVVFHDENMKRLLGVDKNISKVTLDELKGYRYADGQEVLTLDELFRLLRPTNVRPMLEIKSGGIEKEILRLIHDHGYAGEVLVQSFNGLTIKRCHALDAGISYGLCLGPVGKILPGSRLLALQRAIGSMAYNVLVRPYPVEFINIDGPFIYDGFMDACYRHGIKIILGAKRPWDYLDKLERWHVEIINADNPVKMRELVENWLRGGTGRT